jgi:hypothetical protein
MLVVHTCDICKKGTETGPDILVFTEYERNNTKSGAELRYLLCKNCSNKVIRFIQKLEAECA